MRAPTCLASTTALAVALALTLAACKEDDEETPAPVPTTDTAVPAPPPADPAAPVGAAVTGTTPPSQPATPATPTTPTTPGTKVDAGAPADAGKPDASAGDAGGSTSSSKLKACADKCQGVLQACLTPTIPDGGGFPQPKDPAKCQAAFNACSAGCAP